MKDNKYAPYVLGPILLIVWGLIFYKIYQAVYGGSDNFVIPPFHKIPIVEGPEKEESYDLLLSYKDPFLGKKFKGSNHQVTNSEPVRNKVPQPRIIKPSTPPNPQKNSIPQRRFPSIVYQGFQVMDLDTIALLKINNQFYPIARKGEVYQGIMVRGIYKDSIQLNYDNQSQTFPKKR